MLQIGVDSDNIGLGSPEKLKSDGSTTCGDIVRRYHGIEKRYRQSRIPQLHFVALATRIVQYCKRINQ